MRKKLKTGTKPTEGEPRCEGIYVSVTPSQFELLVNSKKDNESLGYYCYTIIKQHLEIMKNAGLHGTN